MKTRAKTQHGHTWGVLGAVAVAAGDTNYIPPFFVPVAPGGTAVLKRVRMRINSGTSVTFKIQRNGGDIPGYGTSAAPLTATTSISQTGADFPLVDNDVLSLVVVAVTGSPQNLSVTVVIEYAT